MTAEEIVMGAYAAFGAGDMDALSKVYHPDCRITMHANHALGGEYHGFNDVMSNMFAKLNDAWPGFNYLFRTDIVLHGVFFPSGVVT